MKYTKPGVTRRRIVAQMQAVPSDYCVQNPQQCDPS